MPYYHRIVYRQQYVYQTIRQHKVSPINGVGNTIIGRQYKRQYPYYNHYCYNHSNYTTSFHISCTTNDCTTNQYDHDGVADVAFTQKRNNSHLVSASRNTISSTCSLSTSLYSNIKCSQQQQQIYNQNLRWFEFNRSGSKSFQTPMLLSFCRSISSTRLILFSDKTVNTISNNNTNNKNSNNNNNNINSNSKSNDNNRQEFISIVTHPEIVNQIPLQDVRNFCFIAHVDHGKSSLSMRVLELTGNLGVDLQKEAWKAVATQKQQEDANDMISEKNKTSTSSTSSSNTDTSTILTSTATHSLSLSSSKTSVNSKEQIDVLDRLAVEQQRGITVKTTTATMLYKHSSATGPTGYLLLNMYDTPGHVDFGKEVTRTLQFVQGAVLLLDSTQGIQAQTWSVYEKAIALPTPPTILMALTKVDMEASRPIHVSLTVSEFFNIDDPDTIIQTSARNRIGVKRIIDAVCEKVPPPVPLPDDDYIDDYQTIPSSASIGTTTTTTTTKNMANPLRAQVIDSWYDSRGVNCLVRIVSGILQEGDKISIVLSKDTTTTTTTSIVDDDNSEVRPASHQQQQDQSSYPVQEVGILLPKAFRTNKLRRGQMGYVRFGLRDPRQAMPGTVLVYNTHINNKNLILPHIPAENLVTKSVLYASVHPQEVDEFEDLCNAIDRLALNDTGLEVSKTASIGTEKSDGPFLGPGLRVGFQGLLHVEVFRQRLSDEFNIDAVVTPPKVPYTIIYQPTRNNSLKEPITKVVEDLSEWVRFFSSIPLVRDI
jgi:translation elongation factor EF-4